MSEQASPASRAPWLIGFGLAVALSFVCIGLSVRTFIEAAEVGRQATFLHQQAADLPPIMGGPARGPLIDRSEALNVAADEARTTGFLWIVGGMAAFAAALGCLLAFFIKGRGRPSPSGDGDG